MNNAKVHQIALGRASSIEHTQRRHARVAHRADGRRGVSAAERQVRTASPICVAQIARQLSTSASQTHRPEALMAFVLFATGADVPSANVQVHQFGYIRANNAAELAEIRAAMPRLGCFRTVT